MSNENSQDKSLNSEQESLNRRGFTKTVLGAAGLAAASAVLIPKAAAATQGHANEEEIKRQILDRIKKDMVQSGSQPLRGHYDK